MSIVLLESPYSGDVARHVAYAQRAMTDARRRNEIALACHLMWTQHPEAPEHFVSDDNPRYRVLGREASLEHIRLLRRRVDQSVFYVDYGYSSGMLEAKRQCENEGLKWEERRLGETERDAAAAAARAK